MQKWIGEMGQTERVAIVTGANRGLGFETCRQLAQQGYQVILTSRDKGKGERAVKELAKSGLRVLYRPLDVQRETSVTQLRDYVAREIGRLDVLVNNAAVLLDESRGVLGTEVEIFRNTMDTNLFGPLRMCQAFVPVMLEHDYGRVVNVSSDAGQLDG
jgi:NAD(P)-dependent dehydrogenase (short-subunit alcohol dehydrogenase family)